MNLTARQRGYAQRIVDHIKAKNYPGDGGQRRADIALATCLVESALTMYANGNNPASLKLPHDAVGWDHGSVGLYQQQVGGAANSTADWGTTAELMNVETSTDKFLRALDSLDWGNRSNGQLAQAVQGSAYPDRYAERDAEAIAIRKALWGKPSKPAKPSKPSKPAKPKPKPSKAATYTVQAGDTLTSIAAKHGTTVAALTRANGIANPDLIFPGQRLKLTGTAGAKPRTVTVKPGDTLTAIAAKHGTTVDHLVAVNALRTPDLIYPGQTIKL